MSDQPLIGYRLNIETFGPTKAQAVSQALSLIASIITSPDSPGYYVGGTSGNGQATFDGVEKP